ncbi:MAG: CDP-diacylglycerol--glycerol-3-phosphate 3-phosphatidyltransferase [Nitrospirota bacterium]|nr:CDP-diacylglycerol--glycerol-3-phosphate 3-phosphatidyltransferase [Nitrospirota bacterium]
MNVPNLLSISRILSIPIFVVLMLHPSPTRALAAGIIFALASITDWLDGYLARKWGQVTKIGKLLDPVADKLLIASALIMLVEVDPTRAPAWIVIVIIGREFAVTGLRAMAASDGIVIPAENMGKYKVGAQITAILSLVSNHYFESPWIELLGSAALWSALVLAIVSGAQYFVNYWRNLD